MSELTRVSLSIEKNLLDKLEAMAQSSGYQNRSEFIRDLVRERMIHAEWQAGQDVLGTLTVIYCHHQRGLTEKLVNLQHHWGGSVLAATHVHLSHEICAEMIMVKGKLQPGPLTTMLPFCLLDCLSRTFHGICGFAGTLFENHQYSLTSTHHILFGE